MEHLLFKAATTATDEGTFTAVISTATVDRDKDIIEPAAMVASLAKWAALGKLVPLAWDHTNEVVGHIDPASASVKNGEVIAAGSVDQSTERGGEAWRLVKSGTLSFSFGFLFDPKLGASKLKNGRYRVKELDVFEISVIPVGPANNDTRVLGWKAAEERDNELQALMERVKALEEAGKEPRARPVDALERKARSVLVGVLADGSKPPSQVAKEQPVGPDASPDDLKRRSRDLIMQILTD